MKIFVYNMRDEELPYFEESCKKYNIEFDWTSETPTLDNAHLAEGCDAIDIITTEIDRNRLELFKKCGVKLVMTRTVGTDHIDKVTAAELGIGVGHINYAPEAVADYTIMLMLMCCRKMKYIGMRASAQDFGLKGRLGKDIHNMTIGIIGTGDIGETIVRHLSGFGCKILAYSRTEKSTVSKCARYVSMDELIRESDIISLHVSGSKETEHIIGEKEFSMMKDGVIFINTARGMLVDTRAMIEAIESGKIGAAGIDVVENEIGMYYYDHKDNILKNRESAILKSYPNVIFTPHMAFYTEAAIHDMVCNSVKYVYEFFGS